MNIAELLADLSGRGITLWVQDDQLHYRAAKGALTPELRTQLGEHKAEILAFLQPVVPPAVETLPPPAPVAQTLPLSFAQERLWFLDQLDRESTIYIEHGATRFIGPFHVHALESSINEVVARHDILRTSFVSRDGQPAQLIAPTLRIPLLVVDYTALPEERRDAEAQDMLERMGRVPFDLGSLPLLRIVLFRLAPDVHLLVVTLHHIISDGWSARIFFREVAALYNAFVLKMPFPLTALPLQYADYASWQRRWLQGQRLEELLTYWRKQLVGVPDVLALPTDYPRPAEMSYRGAHHTFLLSSDLVRALSALSRHENATLFMTLLAALQTLLLRYSGQEDIVVGTQFAARPRRELEQLIGFFINTQALRTDLSGNPSFRALLQRVRETCLDAYEHQDLPFGQLVDALQPRRDLSYTPLFQVLLLLRTGVQMAPFALHALRHEDVPITRTTTRFDLNIELLETDAGLEGFIEYSTDLFAATTIQRFATHWQTLLEEVVARPESRLMDLPLLSQEERRYLLQTCNATQAAFAQSSYIDELFVAQVTRTPGALAVLSQGTQITYAELHTRSNQLAHYLHKLGVGPEIPVALCMTRSIAMVTALLAILKAGGAYLPLDPTYPSERLAWMLADAHATLLLTQSSLQEFVPVAQDIRVICLDQAWPAIAEGEPEYDLPPCERSPAHLAYIIYTSGSTGRPKGVMISHQGLANYVHWSSRYYDVAAGQGAPLHTSLSFDLTITSLFLPLIVGRPVILVPEERGIEDLSATVRAHQHFSPLKITPAHLDVLSQQMAAEEVMHTNHVLVIGGEALKGESLTPWRLHAPATRIINEYGPTETVVGCCIYELPEGETISGNVPIGRPIANTWAFVLDAHLQPVPIGVPGELYIGGAGVARGYLHRPDLTAERFCPNPFAGEQGGAGTRLYRTGDRARWLAHGVLEFLGRVDRQVKLRGYRIEVEEIEAVLRHCPGVREAVVVLREDRPGEARLIAYVVAQPDQEVTPSALRHFLHERVPDYMLPAACVLLSALPLTPNGKLDRPRLPAPDWSQRPGLQGALPGTPLERLLATLWAEVLSLEQVSVQENFFELGGDSIQVIQVCARARQHGLLLLPRQLFQHQTIALLAGHVSFAQPLVGSDREEPVSGPVPLTPIQHWFFEQSLPNPHYWNQARLLSVSAEEAMPQHIDRLREAVAAVLIHHDALRLLFTQTPQGWRQDVVELETLLASTPLEEMVQYIDLRAVSPAQQRVTLEAEAARLQASLHLTPGPLVRVACFDLGTQQHARVLIVVHHLLIDSVSWSTLLSDLQTAYRQRKQGSVPQLPARTTSFQRWARSLAHYAGSDLLRQESSYWLRMASSRSGRSIPVDVEQAQLLNTEASVNHVQSTLGIEETRILLQDIPRIYHTQINDVLLAALAMAYRQWSGSSTLLIDLEWHGREQLAQEPLDLSRTLGWFTAIFPVQLDITGIYQPGDLLPALKEQLRGIPQHGIGYGLLRYLSEDEQVRTQLRMQPGPQVSWNYLGQQDYASNEHLLFTSAPESAGPVFAPGGLRRHLLDILGRIVGRQLQLTWIYSEQVHTHATIERLAHYYSEALHQLIAHCQAPGAGHHTPSDFPELHLNQATLNKIADKMRKGRRS